MPRQMKTNDNNNQMWQTTQLTHSCFQHLAFLNSCILPKCFFSSLMFPGNHFNVWRCDNQKDTEAVLKNLLNHIIVHSLQSCFLHPFFPSRTISKNLKKMKETTVTKMECVKTTPPPHRGQGTAPPTGLVPCPLPFPAATCPLAPSWPSSNRLSRCSPAKGKTLISPGAMMWHLEGSVVFWEIAKLCDYIKVNTIYLHLLSCGLTKGHHCWAHPPAQLQ